jgi:hypothetical protein
MACHHLVIFHRQNKRSYGGWTIVTVVAMADHHNAGAMVAVNNWASKYKPDGSFTMLQNSR